MVEKLRIAVVGSNVVRIPTTKGYMPDSWTAAPSAWNVYNIVEGLVERGHDVTLFASGNSQTSARLESVRYLDSSSDPEVGLENHVQYEFLLLSHAYSMVNQGRFDIINTHIPARSGFFSRFSRVPTVATLHSVLDDNRLVDFSLRNMKDWQHYVSISDAQREPIPDLKYAGTIYEGVNTDEYPWSKDKGDYLLFAGRVVPEKGPDIAIE
ncbi:MAG: glycosyltransferase, partial [Candidatus Nanoarchaeia archaeon]